MAYVDQWVESFYACSAALGAASKTHDSLAFAAGYGVTAITCSDSKDLLNLLRNEAVWYSRCYRKPFHSARVKS